MFDVYRSGKKNPGAFHMTNVILHAMVSCFVVLVAATMGFSSMSATCAGLLFATHPVHVEAVASIVGRAEILSTLLILMAAQVWLSNALTTSRYPSVTFLGSTVKISKYSLSVALILMAGLAKETGFFGGFCIFLMDLGLQLADLESLNKFHLFRSFVLLSCTIVAILFRLSLNGESPPYKWTILENTIDYTEWPLKGFKILGLHSWYMKFLLFGQGLSFDHGLGSTSD